MNHMDYGLEKKHLLLFKAAFGEKIEASESLLHWSTEFNRSDLDWSTRAILPLLVQRFPNQIEDSKRYQRYYQQNWLNNLIKFDYFRKLLAKLSEANIPICLLKGSAMLLYYYKNMGMRPLGSDMDILIPKECLPQAMQILEGQYSFVPKSICLYAGYQFAHQIRQGNSELLKHHHAITYHTPQGSLDLHWQVSAYMSGLSFQSLQKNMNVIRLEQQDLFVLSHEDHFIHTFLRGSSQITHERRLWWLIDICYLLQNQHFDWEKLFALTKERQVEAHLYHTLNLVQTINPTLCSDLVKCKAQKLKIMPIKKLNFAMLHHPNKTVRQIGFYSVVFRHKKSGRFNPLKWMEFIMIYFGFTSYRHMLKRIILG